MANDNVCVLNQLKKPIKLLKWKIREGSTVSNGRIMFLYSYENEENGVQLKLKCTKAGTIRKIHAQESSILTYGDKLCEIEPCNHPTIMNDMCAECGADLRKDDLETKTTASVPMVHAIPELKVSEEQAKVIGKADSERLLNDRKLVLLVDLDQTLIHTTNDNIPANIKDVYHFQLYGSHSPWYHTRLRPGTHQFLENVCGTFELHICTFGTRNYAHMIAMFLDKDQKYFGNRILSRDECFDPTSKKANLKALFPCGDNLVCIIDDREDVWSNALNLIHVKPYHFFKHTGDINAPPGLDKHEEDEVTGIDLTNVIGECKRAAPESPEPAPLNGDENNSQLPEVVEKKCEETDEREEIVVEAETPAPPAPFPLNSDKNNSQLPEITEENSEETVETETETKDENFRMNGNNSEETEDRECKISSEDNGEKYNLNYEKVEENCNSNTESSSNARKSMKNGDKDQLIEVEDPDIYLLYLESILSRIHKTFYEQFDTMESGEVPDLKRIIPFVKSQVLKGAKLCFSGLVPTHLKLEQSKAYNIARGLGAEVTQDLEDDCTHLVAVRQGTAKVNVGKRRKNLKIVTPDWLWCCAERWEHADEKIFPLSNRGSKNRHPPPHCSSPEHVPEYPVHNSPGARKRTPSGRFMDTINPLMSFSSADIADMDKEVEDILDDESDSSDAETMKKSEEIETIDGAVVGKGRSGSSNSSSSSIESLNEELPRGYKRNFIEIDENSDEEPSRKFHSGAFEAEEDEENENESQNSDNDENDGNDGEWNMMGAALEREFLSSND